MKTGQASNTALIVAAGVQMLACDPDYAGLVPDRMAAHGQQLLRTSHPRLLNLIKHQWFRTLAFAAEKITLPGILQHYVLRKKVIRDYVAQSIAAGTGQIVLIGAGYDSLCMELAEQQAGLKLLEIDHPATQAVKRAALGSSQENRIYYIAAELGKQSLAEVLSNCKNFDTNLKTLFIAEGMLMYLTTSDIARLLQQMKMAAHDASLIFTWMEIQEDGQPNFRPASKIIDFFLKNKNEPFLSGMAQDQVGIFLQQHGFNLKDLKESSVAIQQDNQPRPIAGEYICLAGCQRI
ncbi:class I SAM-dependent methyltransferase [Undibacterium sp. Ji42W]|uniref:class I SAM-dependent methyltransferase n=1 Tax=Undibacterium sp. Ji42W TaxID=3413039 RepID=UPI003BEFE21A